MGLFYYLKQIFNDSPPALSYAEDMRRARILKDAPDSEEAKEIRKDKWHRLKSADKKIDKANIKEFKYLCSAPAIVMVPAYYALSPEEKKQFHIYKMNPEHYNNQLRNNGYT